MQKLTEADIIKLMREEWDASIKKLTEAVDATLASKLDGKEAIIMDPLLKLKHKKSQLLYTVISVSPRDVVLRAYDAPVAGSGKSPKPVDFMVDKEEVENAYEIA